MSILSKVEALFDASSALKAKADIDQLKGAAPEAANAIGTLEKAVDLVTNPLVAMGTALLAGVGLMTKLGFEAIETADNLRDLSIGTGQSIAELQALTVVAEKSGSSLQGLQSGLDFIARGMAKGDEETKKFVKAIEFFGISLKNADGSAKDSAQLAQEVAKAYTETADSASKNAAAADALGRNYKELIPTYLELNTAQDEQNFLNQVGATVTAELAAASDEYNDTMRDNKSILQGLGNYAATSFLPVLQAMAEQFKASATNGGLLEGALNILKVAFDGLVFVAKSAVAILIGIDTTFAMLGKSVGAFAAIVASIAKGDFAGAKNIFREWQTDIDNLAQTAGARINKMFEGIKTEAKAAVEETKKVDRGTYRSTNEKAERTIKVKVEKTDAEKADEALQSLIDSLTQSNKAVETGSKLQETAARIETSRYTAGSQMLKDQVLALASVNDQLTQNKKLQKDIEDIQKSGNSAVQGLEDELAKRTMTANAYRRMTLLRQVDLQVAEKVAALNQNIDGYEERRAKLIEEGIQQKERLIATTQALAEADQSWSVGATEALIAYQAELNDVAGMTNKALTNAFQGAEDALVKFVQTGKFDFKSLADSIIADITRMAIRAAIVKPLLAFFGFAEGDAFSMGATTPFAQGDVVTSATTFPMANGVGMLGEAGPEAIMPLKRLPSGRLGVEASGGAGGSGTSIDVGGIYVTVQGGSSGDKQADIDQANRIGAVIDLKLRALVNAEDARQRRPGGARNPTRMAGVF